MKKTKNKKTYYKQTGIKAVKGAEVTDEALDIINNNYAQTKLTADDVYVQKFIQAHNGVDRDRERFPEDLLDDYARTLPGKSFLKVHDKHQLPIGLYFDAKTEEMSSEQFEELTGEKIRLPDGIDKAKVVFSWIYTLKKEWNQELIDNLSAGIYRHTSIGFSATDLTAVKGELEQILYFEYIGPGEAREGSIVYLGAQQGAVVQKDPDIKIFKDAQLALQKGEKLQTLNSWLKTSKKEPDADDPQEKNNNTNKKKGGTDGMEELKKFLEKMSEEFGILITEKDAIVKIKSLITAAGTKATEDVKAAKTEVGEKNEEIRVLNTQIESLTPLAADGKAYRDGLVETYVTNKAKLEEVAEEKTAQDDLRKVVESYPIDFLKSEGDILQKRVEEKFPEEFQVKGDENRDKSNDGKKKRSIVPKDDKK